MPHSLRVRLKKLQRKGELTEKDIDRIFKALEQEPTDNKCHYCEHTYTPYKGNTGEFEQEPCEAIHGSTYGGVSWGGIYRPQEQTGKWIPVTERLPDDHDWYVIVVKEKSTGYQYIPRIASYNHDNCWSIIDTEDADKDWLDDLVCIAWMPLPTPYEPQESEDNE